MRTLAFIKWIVRTSNEGKGAATGFSDEMGKDRTFDGPLARAPETTSGFIIPKMGETSGYASVKLRLQIIVSIGCRWAPEWHAPRSSFPLRFARDPEG